MTAETGLHVCCGGRPLCEGVYTEDKINISYMKYGNRLCYQPLAKKTNMYTIKKRILLFGDMVVQWLMGAVLSAGETFVQNLFLYICMYMHVYVAMYV